MNNEFKEGTTARQRLAEISHHFLSNVDESAAEKVPAQGPSQYTIGLINHHASLPHLRLAEALAQEDLTVSIEAHDSVTRAIFHNHNSPPLIADNESLPSQSITLKLYNTTLPSKQDLHNLLLLPAQASKEGLRQAFIHLKKLGIQHQSIGATIIDSPDSRTAHHCFNQLARASHDFLNRSICSFSFLSNTTNASLAPLVTLIQDDFLCWHKLRINKETPEWTRHSQ